MAEPIRAISRSPSPGGIIYAVASTESMILECAVFGNSNLIANATFRTFITMWVPTNGAIRTRGEFYLRS